MVINFHSPGCIVDEGQLTKVVPFLERRDRALAVDNYVNGTFQQDVPRSSLITLVEY